MEPDKSGALRRAILGVYADARPEDPHASFAKINELVERFGKDSVISTARSAVDHEFYPLGVVVGLALGETALLEYAQRRIDESDTYDEWKS